MQPNSVGFRDDEGHQAHLKARRSRGPTFTDPATVQEDDSGRGVGINAAEYEERCAIERQREHLDYIPVRTAGEHQREQSLHNEHNRLLLEWLRRGGDLNDTTGGAP